MMKTHILNLKNTFIQISETCPFRFGLPHKLRLNINSIAHYQYQMLFENPYAFNAEELLFSAYAIHHNIDPVLWKFEQYKYVVKEQPNLRSSPLCQTYGWGLHCDEHGGIALCGAETDLYTEFCNNQDLKQYKAFSIVELLYGKTN